MSESILLEWATKVAAAAAIFLVGVLGIRLLSRGLQVALNRRMGERELLVRFCVSVVVKGSWTVLFIVVLEKLGVAVAPLVASLGVTGFILGFAFQESLASLAAGIMLAFNQPFKIGDYVAVGGFEGTVKQLDMMAVVLATSDNCKITIPNKQAWGAPIVNYSALALRRVDIPVGIAYGSDITQAREVARTALASLPAVLKEPAPQAEVKSLDDSAVLLTCRAWVNTADYWTVYFAAGQLIHDAFAQAGISIPYPQLDVHLDK